MRYAEAITLVLAFIFAWIEASTISDKLSDAKKKINHVWDSSLHRRPRRYDDENSSKPDFNETVVNETLESKLANMRLGSVLRSRRDELHARKDVENAEVKSAVAAIQAQEAKESALESIADNEEAEKDLNEMHEKLNSDKPLPLSSGNGRIKNKEDAGKDLDGYSNEADDGDEGDKGNDENENEAEETIVEDDVVTIKTTITDSDDDDKDKNNNKSTATGQGQNTTGVCQGLLDLKSMSDDFRQRLQTLIDREEQAVEKLEQLENTFSQTFKQNFQNVNSLMKKASGGRDRENTQPSKACVYIEENIESGNGNIQGSKFTPNIQSKISTDRNKNANPSSNEGQIHVFTSEGVFPNVNPNQNSVYPPFRTGGQQQHQFSNQLPIIQGHLKFPNQNENQNLPGNDNGGNSNGANNNPNFQGEGVGVGSRLSVSRNTNKAKRKRQSNSGASDLEPEIDLENIYWLKTDGQDIKGPASAASPSFKTTTDTRAGNENVNQNDVYMNKKLQSVLKEIQDDNLDLLIIPISSKFDKVQDVAKSFWSSVRDTKEKRFEKDVAGKEKRKRFRMTVRRIK